MLSVADNELLTRVGAGTPTGDLLRQYWHPVLFSHELTTAGDPQRVKLLGEDLIAFRDSSGQPGLIANNCPHRGASLFFGRNEEVEPGLRCVYHGWKFDTTGQCVDMPNEPAESDFRTKVKATAYPCREQGDVIWTYMGPRTTPPALPDLEWAILPAEHRRFPWRAIRQCNWLQAMEGDLDTSHPFFLHARLNAEDPEAYGLYHPDKTPRLFVVDTDVGVMYGSRRQADATSHYWRTSQYLMPNITMFPADPDEVVPGHMWVPMDDTHTLIWCFAWTPTRPLTEQERAGDSLSGQMNELWRPNLGPTAFQPPHGGRPYVNSWAVETLDNDFHLDRQLQRERSFTGIPTIPLQDDAVTTSMGPISDRTLEHLGSADAMIIRVRRRLLAAVRALRERGTLPPGVDSPAAYRKRSMATVLPDGADWVSALRDWHEARVTASPR
ncbi:MAG TPA: Rieske 2Fe-2S domain-containing protein [Chloroflexota bacterium]